MAKRVRKRNRVIHGHNRNLSRSAMSDFLTMLKYKADWYINGATVVDRFFPSSKKCSHCGYINGQVNTTFVREWTCPKCGTHHDRDVNAAINLRDEALRMVNP